MRQALRPGLRVLEIGGAPGAAAKAVADRIIAALRHLDIRYLVDENGGIVALWERHIVQVRAEGPDADILVLRARAYQTVPREWAERGYAAMNEWNRTRRFLKAHLGEPTGSVRALASAPVGTNRAAREAATVISRPCWTSGSGGSCCRRGASTRRIGCTTILGRRKRHRSPRPVVS
ncbi:YbjN domain-containing protein [Glycomyces sp. TRM65418]|uniref:YbjN domain-containing protein n=1 Tax=Glycomyces sp. TRM65418 TaxID=2867006 RepID=UPI0035AB752D|nr:YbjN domain-containing protein [Glycomyces sp. TRM65418]